MIFPIIIFYFIFGIVEMIIQYRKGIDRERYIYIFLYLLLIIFSNLIYFRIIPRNFSTKVLGNLINLLK